MGGDKTARNVGGNVEKILVEHDAIRSGTSKLAGEETRRNVNGIVDTELL